MAFEPPVVASANIATSFLFDVGYINSLDVQSAEFKEFLVRLYQNINNIALVLNMKDTAFYRLYEFNTSQSFFPNPALTALTPQQPDYRTVFRIVVNCGTLPNNATNNIPHNIPNISTSYSFTRIYGAASNQTALEYIPLPYSSVTAIADNIEISIDNTYVYITTGIDRTAFTVSYVVLEYITG